MINCFIRFSAYEAKRLPARFRLIFRLENNTAHGTINRTPNGTIYSATFKRWGYDIFATSSSGIRKELRAVFYQRLLFGATERQNAHAIHTARQ